jgi:outer membrane immunogenic protein
MNNLSGPVALILVIGFALPTKAQDVTPRFEAYARYDYIRDNATNDITHVPPSQSVNGNGAAASWNSTRLAGSLSWDLWAVMPVAREGFATTHQISYLFGPRVNFRAKGGPTVCQVLLGAMSASEALVLGSKTAFRTTAGGGIDVTVSRHFAVRPVQAEYFLTTFPDFANNRRNHFRYGAGIVFRFGRQ